MHGLSLFLSMTLLGLLAAPFAAGQTEFISGSYFPANMEFVELIEITDEDSRDEESELSALQHGPLLLEAGISEYTRRQYGLLGGSALTIEIYTFEDHRGPFSLLTLLGDTSVREGPPGEFLAESVDTLMFAQGPHWVRLQTDAIADLMRRVATSVSNRIGGEDEGMPSLVSHLPRDGYDPTSLRYVLGPGAQRDFTQPIGEVYPEFPALVEIAQGRYEVSGDSGNLTLVAFPTPQMAEDYFDSGIPFHTSAGEVESQMYVRRIGPLLAILEGSFAPESANSLLEPLEFTYSIQWIYDKNNRGFRTVWGVPVGILGTVVRSIFFVVILGASSIVAGAVIAGVRIAFRKYAPRSFRERPDYKDLIRLKIDEN
jgi:hypothetical protein